MRYTCPDAPTMVDGRDAYWMPMDQYIGGISHAILHLLYARFWTKVMRDMGLVGYGEPFTRLFTQGMVLNHAYFHRNDKGGHEYVPPAEVDVVRDDGGRIVGGRAKADGRALEYDGLGTMSKSKLNGVDPQDMIDRYGADAARMYVMFAAPPDQTMEWSDAGVEGQHRYLRKLWSFAMAHRDAIRNAGDAPATSDPALRDVRREIHQTLAKIGDDYERLKYNTVVSGAHILLNALESIDANRPGAADVLREGVSVLLRVLYPVAPHTTWHLWQDLGLADAVAPLLDAPWPAVDPAALVQDTIELVLQVNGKVRGKIVVPSNASQAEIEGVARASPELAKHAGDAPVKKVIVVPGRLVNVVA